MIKSLAKSTGVFVLALTLCLGMTGCAWSVGGQKGGTTVVKPTQGQELIDLQKAHETGALSDEEYERMRNEIVG